MKRPSPLKPLADRQRGGFGSCLLRARRLTRGDRGRPRSPVPSQPPQVPKRPAACHFPPTSATMADRRDERLLKGAFNFAALAL